MDAVEQLLTSALRRPEQLRIDGPSTARIVRGVARRRRRRRAVTVGTALLPAAVLTGVLTGHRTDGTTPRPADPSSTVVPWRDDPATLPPLATRPPGHALYRACRGAQLRAGHPFVGAAAGTMGIRIPLTNTGGSACTLQGYPSSLIGVRADGSTEAVHAQHSAIYGGDGSTDPANLRSGEATELTLTTSGACDALNRPTPPPGDPLKAVRIGVAGGGQVLAAAQFDPTCGLGVTRFGKPRQAVELPPNTYPDLHAELRLPGRVLAGAVLHFSVILSNTGNNTLTFRGCPTYQEGTYLRESKQRILRLNCDQAPSLAPGESREYAMQLPALTAPGTAKVDWDIPTAYGTSAGGTVLVTSA